MVVILLALLFLAIGAIFLRDGLAGKDKVTGQPKKKVVSIIIGFIFLALGVLLIPSAIKNIMAMMNMR